jgi:hypothetical protein
MTFCCDLCNKGGRILSELSPSINAEAVACSKEIMTALLR